MYFILYFMCIFMYLMQRERAQAEVRCVLNPHHSRRARRTSGPFAERRPKYGADVRRTDPISDVRWGGGGASRSQRPRKTIYC